MYSILLSNYSEGFETVKNILEKLITSGSKLVVIPWTFAAELKTKNIAEFFDETRKSNYLQPMYDLGIKERDIIILDCYNHSKEYMVNAIYESDIIILTGGNPEMLYKKVIEAGILESLQKYSNIIIGSSAGAEIQLKKYFITKKNNYYNKFAWYDGFAIIDNDFYFDVHSVNIGRYLPSLKKRSEIIKKTIYCLFDSGAIIYNRDTNELKYYGKVIKFN